MDLFGPPTVDITQSPTLEPKRARAAKPNHTVDAVARSRVSNQCAQILALFQSGRRIEAGELTQIARQYNARIYELREAGHNIVNVKQDKKLGLSWYELLPAERQPHHHN